MGESPCLQPEHLRARNEVVTNAEVVNEFPGVQVPGWEDVVRMIEAVAVSDVRARFTAQPAASLVERDVVALLEQPERRRHAGQASAHDRDGAIGLAV